MEGWTQAERRDLVTGEVLGPARKKLSCDPDGSAVARTSSGSLTFAKITGRVEAKNSGGDIFVQGAGAAVMAETSSG